MSLRVAIVHSFYSSAQPSGENAVVEAEVDLMRDAGVDARLFAARTDDLENERFHRLRSAVKVATGRGRSPVSDLIDFAPDVVHIHNLFPNLARSWIHAVAAPIVVTLHNFRFVCAAATLFRDGHICTDCPDGARWAGVRHRCYRGSAAATLPLAISLRRGPAADPVLSAAARILCLSSRQRELLAAKGIPEDRLVDWVNFLPTHLDPWPNGSPEAGVARDGCLCVGRLMPAKGVVELVSAWTSDDVQLTVVGDGPLLAQARCAAKGRNVEIRGRIPRAEAVELMTRSAALLIPGGWPEVAPLTYIEALASGLPVIARRSTDLAARIDQQGTGVVVDDVSDMGAASTDLQEAAGLSVHCREVFDSLYASDAHRQRLRAVYDDLAR